MATAIGVVMTEHIVAGRLENHQLAGKPVRYPEDLDEVDALVTIPGGELVEIFEYSRALREAREEIASLRFRPERGRDAGAHAPEVPDESRRTGDAKQGGRAV